MSHVKQERWQKPFFLSFRIVWPQDHRRPCTIPLVAHFYGAAQVTWQFSRVLLSLAPLFGEPLSVQC